MAIKTNPVNHIQQGMDAYLTHPAMSREEADEEGSESEQITSMGTN